MSYILDFDNLILNLIQIGLKNQVFDFLMPIFTALGDKGLIWLVISFVLVCNPKNRNFGVMLLCSIIATALLGELFLKNIFDRIRPCYANYVSNLLISPPSSFSFPSGHTASSFASAFILFKWNKKFGILAYFCACVIAFSRLYLLVHYPTDIIGGAILGTLVSMGIYYFWKKKICDR